MLRLVAALCATEPNECTWANGCCKRHPGACKKKVTASRRQPQQRGAKQAAEQENTSVPLDTAAEPTGANNNALGALLAYTFGSSEKACSIYFMRSFVYLHAPQTHLVILHEQNSPPCGPSSAAAVRHVHVPLSVKNHAAWAKVLPPMNYRFVVFDWWLKRYGAAYAFMGFVDMDVIFQLDIFEVLFRSVHRGERRAAQQELHSAKAAQTRQIKGAPTHRCSWRNTR